jgi:DNA-binding NtrC family response regulator
MTDETVPTVLFVDDDPTFLTLVERALQNEPWRVLTTGEPLRALPLVEWEGVDVLVADIMMPQVDGVELLVRARELFPCIPRLVLSGAADADRALRAINDAGVFRFLRKPLDIPELRRAVGAALHERERLRPVEAAERAASRRAEALRNLGSQHPGIESTELRGGAYTLSEERLHELERVFRGSRFAGLLPD